MSTRRRQSTTIINLAHQTVVNRPAGGICSGICTATARDQCSQFARCTSTDSANTEADPSPFTQPMQAGIMWNTKKYKTTTSLWIYDLKWLTYQLTKWVRLWVSQRVCVWKRRGEARVWLSARACYWNAHQTIISFTPSPSPPPPRRVQHPGFCCGSPPIWIAVHWCSNHGAHLGAQRVAMETASVDNRAECERRRGGNHIDSYRGHYHQGCVDIKQIEYHSLVM